MPISMRMTTWRSLAATATAVLAAALLTPAAAHGAPRASLPVYSYATAVSEAV